MHVFGMATPFGSVQFAMGRHNQGSLGADTIIVNTVQYEYRQAVKLEGVKWVADNGGYNNIRRKDWLSRPHNQDGPTDAARQRMGAIIDTLNEEWGKLSGHQQSESRLQAEMSYVQGLIEHQQRQVDRAEEELNDQKKKLADLKGRMAETEKGVFTDAD